MRKFVVCYYIYLFVMEEMNPAESKWQWAAMKFVFLGLEAQLNLIGPFRTAKCGLAPDSVSNGGSK